MHGVDRFRELGCRGSLVNITLRSRGDRLQNRFVIRAGSGHEDSRVRSKKSQPGQGLKKLNSRAAKDYDIHPLNHCYVGDGRGEQVETGH